MSSSAIRRSRSYFLRARNVLGSDAAWILCTFFSSFCLEWDFVKMDVSGWPGSWGEAMGGGDGVRGMDGRGLEEKEIYYGIESRWTPQMLLSVL